MEGLKSISSSDKFTFPSMTLIQTFTFPSMTLIQTQDSEFEFRSVTPAGSPNSPADHLFFNGRLLPHAFPALQLANTTGAVYSRSTSRASSVSSRDSLVSSRSNSTNSRSSSSARTSTSTETNSDQRRSLSCQSNKARAAAVASRDKYTLLARQYGSSQRWQFITPVPALNHQVSRRKRAPERSLVKEGPGRKKAEEGQTSARSGLGRRFFRSFVSACKECHAIKPATRDHVLQGNMELQGSM